MTHDDSLINRNPISFSIWLMPEGSINNQLTNEIQSLHSDFGSPKFKPHVTLLSSFLGVEKELLDKTKLISKKIKPFKIIFGALGNSDDFFQSLYLKVEVTKELKSARKVAFKNFDCDSKSYPFHLSLAYGNYTLAEKEKMISSLNRLPDSFLVNKIFLAHNDEINLRWRVIEGFKLTG